MATSITDVYDNFMSKISDYGFLSDNVTQSDIEDELFGYFQTSRAKFYRCKNDLTVTMDATTEEYMFSVDLNYFEIEILATLMLVEYLKPKMVTDETIKQSLSDKDFKIYSQAGQLREIRLLYQQLKSDASKLISEYTFIDLNSFNQNPPKGYENDGDDNISNNYTGNRASGVGYDDYEL